MFSRPAKASEASSRKSRTEADQLQPINGVDATQTGQDKQYALLFEQHPQPMFVCDRETSRFLTVNEAAIRLYGFSREEFLRLTLLDIRPPEFISRFKESFAATDALTHFGLA